MSSLELLQPDWPQPESVGVLVTTRTGGVSNSPYTSLNLATHVNDEQSHVSQNRTKVAEIAQLHNYNYHWQWMEQVHSNKVEAVESVVNTPVADGLVTSQPGIVCCVLTADCLPVLICDSAGSQVGVAHGGWRGLADGILNTLVDAMASEPSSLMAWLGPAIGPCHFEVGSDVRTRFAEGELGEKVEQHFNAKSDGKFMADLYGIARSQLRARGVQQIYGGDYCTFCEQERFYSYRRDGQTGRMLSAIYLKP